MYQLPITNYPPVYSQPSYSCNGVKIDIHNPQSGGFSQMMPQSQQMQPQNSPYNYPQGSVYAQNPMAYPTPYIPQPQVTQQQLPQVQPQEKPVVVDDVAQKIQPAPQQVATVVPPAPKVIEGPQQVINNNVAAPVAAPKETMTTVEPQAVPNAVKAEDKPQEVKKDNAKDDVKVEIKPSEDLSAKLRGDFVEKLTSSDDDAKAKTLIEISNTIQQLAQMKNAVDSQVKEKPNTPETQALQKEYNKAFDTVAGVVLDEKVVESVLSTLVKDTTSMAGPTPKQIELRSKEIEGKTLTDAEKAEAETLSPMEKAEQNKKFALFTLRLIQEMYMEGVNKMSGSQPEFKDLPGIEQMIVTIKSNPNPVIRSAALCAISHNPREQDKQALNTILKIAAEQDSDKEVRDVAATAMSKMTNANSTNKA